MEKIKLSDMQEYPLLVMGAAASQFRKVFQGPIHKIGGLSDLREFVAYYSAIEYLDRVLVIDEVSNLPAQAENVLLKFLEETPLRVVVLANQDTVGAILLSRFQRVVKLPLHKTQSQFLSLAEGFKKMAEMEDGDRILVMGQVCPQMFYFEHHIKNSALRDRVFNILRK